MAEIIPPPAEGEPIPPRTPMFEQWQEFAAGVAIVEGGRRGEFNANHPSYPIAMAAFYAGWRASTEHWRAALDRRLGTVKPKDVPPLPSEQVGLVKPGDRFVKRHPDGTTEHFEAVPGEGIVPQLVGHYAPTPDRPASPARPCPDKFPHVEHDWIVDRGTFRCPGRER